MTMSERSSKVVVKDNSQVNSSSRIYYYGGASVPFLWETRPGTPKHPLFSESFRLPPLTPPPSYYSSSSSSSSGNKLSKVRMKQTRFVKTLFNRKHHVSHPSISWSSTTFSSSYSSSSSSSSPRSKTVHPANKCYLSCSRSYVKDDDEEESGSSTSPTSTLCYKRGFSMKRALSSILSHKSSRNDLRLI
ncbi:unnamed protein product [Brassica oleracea var. botrytis]